MNPVLTSNEWWQATKSDSDKFTHWLQHQYLGELSAVHLLSTILLKYNEEMTATERRQIALVIQDEITHSILISNLLEIWDIPTISDIDVTHRYWNEVLPAVTNFKSAMQAAALAEEMRLYRIRAIVADSTAHSDILKAFRTILSDEEWHAKIFAKIQGDYNDPLITESHQKGLSALSLVLQ